LVSFSLRSIMFFIVYAAVCCTVYVTSNMWAGWLVVWATAGCMAVAIVHASKSQSSFSQGFAVAGCAWLIIWLGFAVETSARFNDIPIRTAIYDFVSFGPNVDEIEYDKSKVMKRYADAHDLYASMELSVLGTDPPHVPNWHNVMRLAVCLSSLLFGCFGGLICRWINSRSTLAE